MQTTKEIIEIVSVKVRKNGFKAADITGIKKDFWLGYSADWSEKDAFNNLILAFSKAGLDVQSCVEVISEIAMSWLVVEDNPLRNKQAGVLPKIARSFEWNHSQASLAEVFGSLSGKWVHPQVSIDQFTVVFSGQPLNSINPIKWNSNNLSEVLYFIRKLHEYSFV